MKHEEHDRGTPSTWQSRAARGCRGTRLAMGAMLMVAAQLGCSSKASSSEGVVSDEVGVGASLPPGQLARIGKLRLSHGATPSAIGFTADGALVSSSQEMVRVWEPAGGLRWQSFEPIHDAAFTSFVLSADGALVAVSHRDLRRQKVTIYEASGRARKTLQPGRGEPIALSADGTKLVMTTSTESLEYAPPVEGQAEPLEIFDVDEERVLTGLHHEALAASFLDDQTLIVVSKDGVRRWSWLSGDAELVQARDEPSRNLTALTPDGRMVAWAEGRDVTILALGKDGKAGERTVFQAEDEVRAVVLAPRGDQAALLLRDRFAVWSLGEAPKQTWSAARSVWPIAFSRDGKTLVTGELQSLVRWDAESGATAPEPAEELMLYSFDAAGNPIVRRGTAFSKVELKSGELTPANGLFVDAPKWRSGSLPYVAFGPGKLLMSWDAEGTLDCAPLRVWLRGSGERVLPQPARCGDSRLGWFAGAGMALGVGEPFEVHDVVKGELRLKGPEPGGKIFSAAFSADRRWLVVAREPVGTQEQQAAQERHYVVEAVELTKGKPAAAWAPNRVLAWREREKPDVVAVLDDGTIFVGLDDGRVMAAMDGGEWAEVARMNQDILMAFPSPTGKAAAFIDIDSQALVLSGDITKAAKAAKAAKATR